MLRRSVFGGISFLGEYRLLGQVGFIVLLCSASASHAEVSAVSVTEQAEVKLALGIVHKYRDLRASCRSLPDDQKSMCFYRLKIGNWDYKEAKLILAKHKLI